MPFRPGRRPTDEDRHPGLGSSDNFALVTEEDPDNRATVLFEIGDLPEGASIVATLSVDGTPLPDWERRPIEVSSAHRQRVSFSPNIDLTTIDLGLRAGFLRRLVMEIEVLADGEVVDSDETIIEVADARNLGSLYKRIVDRLLVEDTRRQAERAGAADLDVAFHPWFPVLEIGGDKAALYNEALHGDIVEKQDYLTDPSWLLRVGIYLELLTCLGIFEALREEFEDLLDPDERVAFESDPTFDEIWKRIDPEAWRRVWQLHGIIFPGFGTPRAGPVSMLNLLRKREATLAFLHVHHDDLKQAIELAGPNTFNAQETWQRVFRDAERAVMRNVADAFPELDFVPEVARDVILWQRWGFAGQQGLFPTACNQYRASMNTVADWGAERGLMNHAGNECIPPEASLLEAYHADPPRCEILQRQDGLGPDLLVCEPAVCSAPTIGEIEAMLGNVPILSMMSADDVRQIALGARPLLMGPTQRFVVEGQEGTSLFLVGEGMVEVRLRKPDGTDWLVETMGPGEVVGEMALLTGEKRSATVRSVDESLILEISRELYEPLIRANPQWVEELSKVMEERLARRRIRLEETESSGSSSLLERILQNFFN